ncbi:hypothetical protein PAXRUDRAFT_30940 [Paxillus rubicundulus Ve08.2h10]|uniref:No apical meristem-associated C-terminal domain-containing protein n=1 Tax=Paxillus rubicundulus Ve08.2h10 TaxID=930991 RepID=A0A0D0E3I3_9AGAM|nr:hypothetical protein PAXRUDRAFT_30940 [Paxillus rubicundulus Ve08.2h10]
MLTEITEDEDIKQGQFPVPGANPCNQGLPKTHWHWAICEKLYLQHHNYQEKFTLLQKISTAKQKEAWHTKIKNWLKRMTDNMLKHIEVMGQTGAGIKTCSEIDTNQQNAFVTKWNNILGSGYVSKPWDIEKDAEGSENELDSTLTPTELSKKQKAYVNVDKQPEKIAQTVATTSTKKKSKKMTEKLMRQNEMEVAKVRAERDLVRSKVKLVKIELQRENLCEKKEHRQDHYRERHPVALSFNFSLHDDLTSNFGGSSTLPEFTPLASRSSSESTDLYTLPAALQWVKNCNK